MKRFLIFLCIGLPALAAGQSSDTVTVDILRAPSSPAFNILGISPSAIERPTDLNAFRVSVQNASGSFTRLPGDYSVEISPASLAKIGHLTLDQYDTPGFATRFWQSLSLSFGLAHGNREDKETGDSTSFTKAGIGVKFSIFRPGWTRKTRQSYHALQAELNRQTHQKVADIEDDSAYHALDSTRSTITGRYKRLIDSVSGHASLSQAQIQAAVKQLRQQRTAEWKAIDSLETLRLIFYANQVDTPSYNALKKSIGAFRIDRKGWFLDAAGGIALDFPDDRFDYSLASKAGAWLTGGYENSESGWSALAIARYLYQPHTIFADTTGRLDTAHISTFDAGARILYTAPGGKFSLSAEAIYRSVLNKHTIDPTWRFTLNADYDIGLNRKLTFAFGKNFDGTLTKGGNIIAALNFIAGFGSSRKTGSGVGK